MRIGFGAVLEPDVTPRELGVTWRPLRIDDAEALDQVGKAGMSSTPRQLRPPGTLPVDRASDISDRLMHRLSS